MKKIRYRIQITLNSLMICGTINFHSRIQIYHMINIEKITVVFHDCA